jgi:hypothetical protein
MGADEYYWPKADYNLDEIVNFFDFAVFAPAWLTTNENISLDEDSDVDMDDLAQFCEDWLWVAPWSQLYQMLQQQRENAFMSMSARIAAEQLASFRLSATLAVEEPALSCEMSEPLTAEGKIEKLVEWLDGVWQSGELDWSEQEYLDFRGAIQELPE